MTKIKRIITTLLVSASLLMPGLLSFGVSPAYATALTELCSGINGASAGSSCGPSGGTTTTSISSVANTVVNIFTYVVGIISVIMLIVAGFRYVTSGGESSKVSGAKNTLIYAIVGIVIVLAAKIIVSFVANQTGTVTGS